MAEAEKVLAQKMNIGGDMDLLDMGANVAGAAVDTVTGLPVTTMVSEGSKLLGMDRLFDAPGSAGTRKTRRQSF